MGGWGDFDQWFFMCWMCFHVPPSLSLLILPAIMAGQQEPLHVGFWVLAGPRGHQQLLAVWIDSVLGSSCTTDHWFNKDPGPLSWKMVLGDPAWCLLLLD